MSKLLRASLPLICIILLGSDAYSVEKIRKPILEKHRENFDIQLKLYSGETLPELIPSLKGKIAQNEELLKMVKYLFISAINKAEGTAFLTIEIKSPNNPQLGALHKLSIPPSRSTQERVYELVYLNSPVMQTSDEDAILDYEITDVWYK